MPAAYVTMVQIPTEVARAGVEPDDSFAAVSVVSIALAAVADTVLADELRQGRVYPFYDGLVTLLAEGYIGANVSLETLDVSISPNTQRETLQRLVASGLLSETPQQAQQYWNSGTQPDESLRAFLDLILNADVLVAHSEAKQESFNIAALKVAGTIGGGAMTAGVAVIHIAGVTGVVVAIAGTGGIALVGVGASVAAYRLLTHRRRGG